MKTDSLNKISATNNEISLKELIITVKDWWKSILKKWMIILILGILGGILGFIYATLKKPLYTASTTFVLEDDRAGGGGGLGSLAGLVSMAGVDIGSTGGGIFQGDNLLELYKSHNMIQKTLLSPLSKNSKELLIDQYIKINTLRKVWSENEALSHLSFSKETYESAIRSQSSGRLIRLRDSVLGSIVNDINKKYLIVSKPDKKLSIIKVDVKSKDEFFSKAFNDLIVQNVNDFYVQTKTKKSLQNLAILQHQTDSVKNVLNGAIYSSIAVSDATPNLNPTRQVLRAPAQRSQFNAEANKAILTQLVQNLELAKLSLRKETPLIQIIDAPVFPLTKLKPSPIIYTFIGCIAVVFLVIAALTVKIAYKKLMDS